MIASRAGRLVPAQRASLRAPLVRYRHRGLKPDDAVLVSYPKSGSTWLRFLLAHLLSGAEADYGSIRALVPPLGVHRGAAALLPNGGRLVRSHEPLSRFRGPGSTTLTYLLRDPRDVCLSYFNHRRRQGYKGDFATFAALFLDGRVDGYGTWDRHVATALRLQAAGHRHLLVVRYEDLRSRPVVGLAAVLRHLGVAVDDARIGEALAANTRERMRAKEDNAFLTRVGMAAGGLSPEHRRWDELVPPGLAERFLSSCGAWLERCGYPTTQDSPRDMPGRSS